MNLNAAQKYMYEHWNKEVKNDLLKIVIYRPNLNGRQKLYIMYSTVQQELRRYIILILFRFSVLYC